MKNENQVSLAEAAAETMQQQEGLELLPENPAKRMAVSGSTKDRSVGIEVALPPMPSLREVYVSSDKEKHGCGNCWCCGTTIPFSDFMRRRAKVLGHSETVCGCCLCCVCFCAARYGLIFFTAGGLAMLLFDILIKADHFQGWKYRKEDSTMRPHCADACNCSDVTYYDYPHEKGVLFVSFIFDGIAVTGYALAVAAALLEKRILILLCCSFVVVYVLGMIAVSVAAADGRINSFMCRSKEVKTDTKLTRNLDIGAVLLAAVSILFLILFPVAVLWSAYLYWRFLSKEGTSAAKKGSGIQPELGVQRQVVRDADATQTATDVDATTTLGEWGGSGGESPPGSVPTVSGPKPPDPVSKAGSVGSQVPGPTSEPKGPALNVPNQKASATVLGQPSPASEPGKSAPAWKTQAQPALSPGASTVPGSASKALSPLSRPVTHKTYLDKIKPRDRSNITPMFADKSQEEPAPSMPMGKPAKTGDPKEGYHPYTVSQTPVVEEKVVSSPETKQALATPVISGSKDDPLAPQKAKSSVHSKSAKISSPVSKISRSPPIVPSPAPVSKAPVSTLSHTSSPASKKDINVESSGTKPEKSSAQVGESKTPRT